MKAIVLLLVVAVLYWIFFGRSTRTGPVSVGGTKPQKIVSCGYCHLHVPDDEAIHVSGRSFCCDEHRRLDES